jgi:hypothetical protein
MAVAAGRRRIEKVPTLLIGILEAAGQMPHLPAPVAALEQAGRRRDPTLAEASALSQVQINSHYANL